MENLNLTSSKFSSIFYNAYDIANNESERIIFNSLSKYKRKSFNRVSEIDTFIASYLDLLDSIKNADDESFIKLVKSFGKFLRIAEKCNYYRNESSDTVYSEIDTKNNKIKLVLFDNDALYQVIIEKSKIADITIPSTKTVDSFLSSLDDNSVSFVNIVIDRCYGKEMSNTFKYLSTDRPIFYDRSDEILYGITKSKILDGIIKTFDNIITSVFNSSKTIKYFDPTSKSKLIIGDIIEYGLWIYK